MDRSAAALEGSARAARRARPRGRALPQRLAVLALRYGILLVLTVIFLGPWLYLFTTSLKTPDAVLAYPPQWIPQDVDWNNYALALTRIPFLHYLGNTLFLVCVNVVGQLLSCSLVAYALACIDWPGRRALFIAILATLMLPTQATLVPVYILFSQLHWVNTFLPLTVPGFFGNAAYIFLLRQFFLTVSRDVSEAARLDGASDLRIYWSMVLPLARPGHGRHPGGHDDLQRLLRPADLPDGQLALDAGPGPQRLHRHARLGHRGADGGDDLLRPAADRPLPGRPARLLTRLRATRRRPPMTPRLPLHPLFIARRGDGAARRSLCRRERRY